MDTMVFTNVEYTQTATAFPQTLVIDPTEETGGLADRHASQASTTNASISTVSTAKYEREQQKIEEIFYQRIEKLCRLLWAPSTSFWHRFSTGLRHNKILRSFVPAPQTPLIERLQGGDWNHITAITLPVSYKGTARSLILRVPRWDQDRLDRSAAIVHYVQQKSRIPVPSIVALDSSSDNPLEKPYMLQHRVPGMDLNTAWDTLTYSQRLIVASELGRIIRTLLSMESTVSGIIEALGENTNSAGYRIVPFEMDACQNELDEKPDGIDRTSPPTRQSTLNVFECQVQRWRAIALAQSCGVIDTEVEIWDRMLKAVCEMDEMGLMSAGLCLCHVDLHAGNIMFDIRQNMSIRISAVLDWDEAIFAPKVCQLYAACLAMG